MEEDKERKAEAAVAMEVKDLPSWCLIHMVNESQTLRSQRKENRSFIALTVIRATDMFVIFPGSLNRFVFSNV